MFNFGEDQKCCSEATLSQRLGLNDPQIEPIYGSRDSQRDSIRQKRLFTVIHQDGGKACSFSGRTHVNVNCQ